MDNSDFEFEWQKMLAGEVYEAGRAEFGERLMATRKLLKRFNDAEPDDLETLEAILRGLLGGCGANVSVNQPFRCDYGCNISVGDNFTANFNLTILDEARVTIGDDVFIGPNVGIYTACHPLDAAERSTRVEWAEPVTIGDGVWIGGGVVILPGVTIGEGSVIGGGSVVSRDVPARSVAVGNPARVIKSIVPVR